MNKNNEVKQAFSINEFCQNYGFSRAKFYLLLNEGRAPKIMKIGRRSLISREAADRWRKAMEGSVNA